MAYGGTYYNNNYNQGNNSYGQGNGGHQRQGGYQRQGNYQQQQPAPKEPVNPEEFIQERIDTYNLFINKIRENGLDPADFAFALGGWVTSFCLENKKK